MPKGTGCVLVIEMSTSGSLTTPDYTDKSLKMAEEAADFVVGLVCQRKHSDIPQLIHMTPGYCPIIVIRIFFDVISVNYQFFYFFIFRSSFQ